MQTTFNSFYFQFSSKMEKHSINLMRIALSLVYVWFGVLKIVGMSPAGELVKETVYWFSPGIFIPILGICEVLIGLGLLIRKLVPFAVVFLLLHMIATFFPIIILNSKCFDAFPYCPTLVGQYIIKNVVLASGAFVIAGNYKSNRVES